MQGTIARLAQEADAPQIAQHAVSTWRAIEASLSPIVGQRAVTALYRRSVTRVRAEHSWLEHGDDAHDNDWVLLQDALAGQSSTAARAAHLALLQAFEKLLISLLGESLCERLLKPVLDISSTDDTTQEPE